MDNRTKKTNNKRIEVCQWLLNGMIVAALLNLCGKIQTKCKLEKIW